MYQRDYNEFDHMSGDQFKQEQNSRYPLSVGELNPNKCPCRGGGWVLNPRDFWQKCPIHYCGQEHPEYEHPEYENPEYEYVEDPKIQEKILAMHKRIYGEFLKQAQALGIQHPNKKVNILVAEKGLAKPDPLDFIDAIEELIEKESAR